MTLPRGYSGPHDPTRDTGLCARCGDPIRRLADNSTRTVGLNPAWLDSLEAIDPEAISNLRGYLYQLAILWHYTWWALDGGAKGSGVDEIRTHQRGGDPTGNRIRDGQWNTETGEQLREPQIADDAAAELRRRSQAEAKRIRDAAMNLQRYLANCDLAVSPNLERERRRGLRDDNGRLVS